MRGGEEVEGKEHVRIGKQHLVDGLISSGGVSLVVKCKTLTSVYLVKLY